MLASTTKLALCHSTKTLLTPCTQLVQNASFPYLIAPVGMSIRRLNGQQLKQRIKLLKAPVSQAVSENGEGQPLVLLFAWLMSKERHIKKYVQFYNNLGADVLTVQITPKDLLFPTKGTQIVAEEVLQLLQSYPVPSRCIVHGFSVGAYAFCEACVKMNEIDSQYKQLQDRFVGQIWDSPVDIQGIPTGMPSAISSNKLFRKGGKIFLENYLEKSSASKHYKAASSMFREPFLKIPALFLISKTDPVSTPDMIDNATKDWNKHNVQMTIKSWEKSPHVSHYHHHKKEYEDQILKYLQKIKFIPTLKSPDASKAVYTKQEFLSNDTICLGDYQILEKIPTRQALQSS